MIGRVINWSIRRILRHGREQTVTLREKFIHEAEADINRRLRGCAAIAPNRASYAGGPNRDRRMLAK